MVRLIFKFIILINFSNLNHENEDVDKFINFML